MLHQRPSLARGRYSTVGPRAPLPKETDDECQRPKSGRPPPSLAPSASVRRACRQDTLKKRLATLRAWQDDRSGGLCIIGFEAFLTLVGRKTQAAKEAAAALQDPGPDLVVLDEGHRIKNVKSKQNEALSAVRTRDRRASPNQGRPAHTPRMVHGSSTARAHLRERSHLTCGVWCCATGRRLILTGTPLQNNLLEYHAMISFIRPSLLGSEHEFRNRFVNPINNALTTYAVRPPKLNPCDHTICAAGSSDVATIQLPVGR